MWFVEIRLRNMTKKRKKTWSRDYKGANQREKLLETEQLQGAKIFTLVVEPRLLHRSVACFKILRKQQLKLEKTIAAVNQ